MTRSLALADMEGRRVKWASRVSLISAGEPGGRDTFRGGIVLVPRGERGTEEAKIRIHPNCADPDRGALSVGLARDRIAGA